MSAKIITIAVASIVLLYLAVQASGQGPITDVCLGCICEAISGCNLTKTCANGVCGLFRISWGFWADGGKLTLNGEDQNSDTAFPNCVNDPYCAANTIQNYMQKFGQDCNGDQIIDCYDYAAIHVLGPYGCKGNVPAPFATTLNECLNTFKG